MNDQELRKILDDIPKHIVSGLKPVLEAITITTPKAAHQSGLAKSAKWVGLIGGILAILASAAFTLNFIVSNAIDKSLDGPDGIRAQLASMRDKDIGGLRSDVNRLNSWYDHQIFSSNIGAAKGVSPEDIKYAAKRLRDSGTVIPVDQIQRVSTPLFQPPVTPAKWEAVMQLANLRSFVNSTLEYAKQHITITVQAGRDHLIPAHKADEWVELVGGVVILDGIAGDVGGGSLLGRDGHVVTVIGNLIIKDSTVRYRGGKVTLVNVFFDNCTFEITNNDNGMILAKNLLEPSPFTRFVAD
jgi:hypothetical protein